MRNIVFLLEFLRVKLNFSNTRQYISVKMHVPVNPFSPSFDEITCGFSRAAATLYDNIHHNNELSDNAVHCCAAPKYYD